MLIVVTGGSGSGKSAFAEQRVLELGEGQRIYLATMMCFDEESKKRIARHRQMRKEKRFSTIERYTDLAGATVPEGSTVLLECMSNLVANEMYAPGSRKEDCVDRILFGLERLESQACHVVVVTNEIFSDGFPYGEETVRYQQYLGEINRRMAGRAQEVTEVVYGIPVLVKRKEEER